jgi:hypothetical protein
MIHCRSYGTQCARLPTQIVLCKWYTYRNKMWHSKYILQIRLVFCSPTHRPLSTWLQIWIQTFASSSTLCCRIWSNLGKIINYTPCCLKIRQTYWCLVNRYLAKTYVTNGRLGKAKRGHYGVLALGGKKNNSLYLIQISLIMCRKMCQE